MEKVVKSKLLSDFHLHDVIDLDCRQISQHWMELYGGSTHKSMSLCPSHHITWCHVITGVKVKITHLGGCVHLSAVSASMRVIEPTFIYLVNWNMGIVHSWNGTLFTRKQETRFWIEMHYLRKTLLTFCSLGCVNCWISINFYFYCYYLFHI